MINTKKKYKIKDMFKDHWHLFLGYIYARNKTLRHAILHEVERILSCQSGSGYSVYGCVHCHILTYVPFTCKSRFCNCCGALYSSNRAKSIKSKLYKCNHRHVIFTIPEELRIYFLNDRKLLNTLFTASSETLLSWFAEQQKSKHFSPGIVCALHTFGRDLKWNPHIHMLVSEGAFSRNSEWRTFSHIPFEMLRKRWQFILLQHLSEKINTSDFRALKNKLYKKYPKGFYVNAVKKPIMSKGVVNYIVRYIGRPVMAQSRILDYNQTHVTFWYQPHGSTEKVFETVTIFDFISRLIRHIPERHFKMLRYFGFYHSSSPLYHKINRSAQHKPSYWRQNIKRSFSYDPILCSNCDNIMELLYIKHPKKPEKSFDKNLIYYDSHDG